jgi:hypothetical protein
VPADPHTSVPCLRLMHSVNPRPSRQPRETPGRRRRLAANRGWTRAPEGLSEPSENNLSPPRILVVRVARWIVHPEHFTQVSALPGNPSSGRIGLEYARRFGGAAPGFSRRNQPASRAKTLGDMKRKLCKKDRAHGNHRRALHTHIERARSPKPKADRWMAAALVWRLIPRCAITRGLPLLPTA